MFILFQDQVQELEEKLDNLTADFSDQSRQEVDLKDSIHHLESEISKETDLANQSKEGTSENKKHTELMMAACNKMSNVKSQLTSLTMKKTLTKEKLEACVWEMSKVKAKLGVGKDSEEKK